MDNSVKPEEQLEEQRQRADELSHSMNVHVLQHQKLCTVLESEFGLLTGWDTDESPEGAAIRLLRAQAVTITELRDDLKSAEEEATRFSKQCRQVSARNTELLAEVKILHAEVRAEFLKGEEIDLSLITKAELTGESFETFANYFIVEAVVELDRQTGTREAVHKVFGSNHDKISKAKIRLSINGVDLPFIKVLQRFHADWDRVVRASAVQLAKEEFAERTSAIYELLDDMKEQMERQLGVSQDDGT